MCQAHCQVPASSVAELTKLRPRSTADIKSHFAMAMLCSLPSSMSSRPWRCMHAQHLVARKHCGLGKVAYLPRHSASRVTLCKSGSSGSAAESHLTPPLQVSTVKTLTEEERMPSPLWGTFCGVSNGLWVGTAAAYSPYTGAAEPVSLEGKKAVYQQGTCVVEERVQEEGRDIMLRRRAYTNTEEAFHEALRQGSLHEFGGGGEGEGTAEGGGGSIVWLEEELDSQQQGLAIFDGGSYTSGPTCIGFVPPGAELEEGDWEDDHVGLPEGDADEGVEEEGEEGEEDWEGGSSQPPPDTEGGALDRLTTLSEWVLQWGSGHRVRLQLTLSTVGGLDGGELDVEVLRVALAREQWEGLPGTYAPSAALQEGMSLAGGPGPRLSAKQLEGSWRVFEIGTITVEDVSMATGLPAQVSLYTTRETLQKVRRQRQQQQQQQGGFDDEDVEDGAVLWLPHQVALELRMLWPDASSGNGAHQAPAEVPQNGASANGNGSGAVESGEEEVGLPGLRVAVSWVPENGKLVSLAREYSGEGELQRVTYNTAIRA